MEWERTWTISSTGSSRPWISTSSIHGTSHVRVFVSIPASMDRFPLLLYVIKPCVVTFCCCALGPVFSGEACRGDPEQWFFFVPRKENEVRGGRPNRLTTFGYWKATGSPGYVYSSSNRIVGFKRTMVFYNGRAPSGVKTEWKMNEYMVLEGGCDHDASSSNSSIISHVRTTEYIIYMHTYIYVCVSIERCSNLNMVPEYSYIHKNV